MPFDLSHHDFRAQSAEISSESASSTAAPSATTTVRKLARIPKVPGIAEAGEQRAVDAEIVPATVAAREAKMSPRHLRELMTLGTIPAHVLPDGRRGVRLEEVLEYRMRRRVTVVDAENMRPVRAPAAPRSVEETIDSDTERSVYAELLRGASPAAIVAQGLASSRVVELLWMRFRRMETAWRVDRQTRALERATFGGVGGELERAPASKKPAKKTAPKPEIGTDAWHEALREADEGDLTSMSTCTSAEMLGCHLLGRRYNDEEVDEEAREHGLAAIRTWREQHPADGEVPIEGAWLASSALAETLTPYADVEHLRALATFRAIVAADRDRDAVGDGDNVTPNAAE